MRASRIENDEDKFVKLMHLGGRKIQELHETQPIPRDIAERPRGPMAGGYALPPNDYETALAKLNAFFLAKKNATYERHQFRLLKQESDEKIGTFAMRLRAQAERCSFGGNADEHIKDQLIEKCLSPKLRIDMLRCGDANLEKILNTAMNFEAIEEQRKAFEGTASQTNNTPSEVNKIEDKATAVESKQPPSFDDKQMECTRCGFTGHRSFEDKCPAKGKTCNKCGGKDHFSRKCRSKKRRPNWSQGQKPNTRFTQSHEAANDENKPDNKRAKNDESVKYVTHNDEYVFCMGDLHNEINCTIGGIEAKAVIDSGSRYNIMDVQSWDRLKQQRVAVTKQRQETDKSFKSYGNHPLTVIGVFEAIINIADKSAKADFYVVKDFGKTLIGYETAMLMGILKIGADADVNNINAPTELGKIKDVVVRIPIKQDVKPVIEPYRRVPIAREETVNKKIDELLQSGVIEKVTGPSKWISQLVIAPKKDDVRICVDMRRANEAIERENYPLPTMEDFLPQIGNSKYFAKYDVKHAFHQVDETN